MKTKERFASIFFIPFAVETYAPITVNNIERESHFKIGFYTQHPLCDQWLQLFSQRQKDLIMDNKKIRLKFEDYRGKEVYYVDQGGVVKRNDEKTFFLTGEELKNIEKEIKYFSGVVDLGIDDTHPQ